MPTTRPPLERLKFHRGTRTFLRSARSQIKTRYGLAKEPSFTALVVAGVRSLAFLTDELHERPYGNPEKLSVWTSLVEGVSLPPQVETSISEDEASRLLVPAAEDGGTRGQ